MLLDELQSAGGIVEVAPKVCDQSERKEARGDSQFASEALVRAQEQEHDAADDWRARQNGEQRQIHDRHPQSSATTRTARPSPMTRKYDCTCPFCNREKPRAPERKLSQPPSKPRFTRY